MMMEQVRKAPSLVHMPNTLGFSAVYPDSIKMVSDFIFKKYHSEEKTGLTRESVCQMMRDMYRSFNLDFMPSQRDIDQFMRLMDIEKNGLINEKNVDRLARKHVAVSKYDLDKRMKSEGTSYLSISSASSQRQSENVTPLSQTQAINFQPLQAAKNFSNTANITCFLSKASTTFTTHSTSDPSSKENFNPQNHFLEKNKISDEIVQAFSEFDFNKDGKINSFECQRSLMRFGWKFGVNPTKINLESLFSKADTDKDGMISLHEFASCILKIN